jgi:hypothetical protein
VFLHHVSRPARLLCFLFVLLGIRGGKAYAQRAENVIIITLDGVRWQEVFSGVDSALVHDPRYTPGLSGTKEAFWTSSPVERRRRLLPFLWDSIVPRGVLLGDRNAGSLVDITNAHRFSYPGYSEILTGFADDERIKSNNKIPNPNRTVLEFLNEQAALKGKVAAFASWDVFPFIINEERSGVPVNSGPEPMRGALSAAEQNLNRLQEQLPQPWPGIRHDALTYNFALEYLKRARPRVLYIGFDETDDFAHGKQYHAYVRAMRRTDDMIRELWQWVQSTDGYRNNTNFIITTDHGRGNGDRFGDHAKDVEGAQHIWIAMFGPDIKHVDEANARGQFRQNQIARTVAELLGVTYAGDPRIGEALRPGRP